MSSAFYTPSDMILQNAGPVTNVHSVSMNPQYGGQFGWTPNYKQFLSKQAHVRRHVVPVMLAAPKFVDFTGNPDLWRKMLKMIMEVHPESIEGLNATLEVSTDTHNFGGGGQLFHEAVDSKMTQSEIVKNYTDTYGYGLSRTLQYWIDYAILNAEAKAALVSTLSPTQTSKLPAAWTADYYSAIMMYYEPDPLHRRVQRAWLVGNMWPTSSGDITGKSDKANAMEIAKLSIKFTGFTQHTDGVTRLAQEFVNTLRFTNADPWKQPAFVEKLNDTLTDLPGWKSTVDDLSTAVTSQVGGGSAPPIQV